MLQCVAECCSVLQCAVVCCGVLQCVAVCCSVLQGVAVCCSVLQCVAVCCSVLQCVAAMYRLKDASDDAKRTVIVCTTSVLFVKSPCIRARRHASALQCVAVC